MKKLTRFMLAFGAVAAVSAGCEIFEDQTPETISFTMTGDAGTTVTVLYTSAFIAGVNEDGVTRVEVFDADTVIHTLPIDTIVDVSVDRRLLIRVAPAPTDTISVDVRVLVNDRELVNDDGRIYPEEPWVFLYQFNARFTNDVEVII